VVGFDNVHPIQTEVHPVLGLAVQVNSTETEDYWVIMARRSGNEGACSHDDLHYLHDTEINEMRFMLYSGASEDSAVGPGTQFKWSRGFQSGDTSFSVDFGSSGTVLRIPLQPERTVVLAELHITHPPRLPISVFPNQGTNTGGTPVIIVGQGFLPGATVLIGGTLATDVRFVNTWTLTATTPAHAIGSVDVSVIVNGQTRSTPNAFTYVMHPAQIMSLVSTLLQ
jgi:hypothetical protein